MPCNPPFDSCIEINKWLWSGHSDLAGRAETKCCWSTWDLHVGDTPTVSIRTQCFRYGWQLYTIFSPILSELLCQKNMHHYLAESDWISPVLLASAVRPPVQFLPALPTDEWWGHHPPTSGEVAVEVGRERKTNVSSPFYTNKSFLTLKSTLQLSSHHRMQQTSPWYLCIREGNLERIRACNSNNLELFLILPMKMKTRSNSLFIDISHPVLLWFILLSILPPRSHFI